MKQEKVQVQNIGTTLIQCTDTNDTNEGLKLTCTNEKPNTFPWGDADNPR